MSTSIYHTVRLLRLYCYRQHESDGDEIFIKYQKKKVWPVNAKYKTVVEGEESLNHDIIAVENDTSIIVELWDYDFVTSNDKLGVFSMLINERGGPFITDLKKQPATEDAKYSIAWEVL